MKAIKKDCIFGIVIGLLVVAAGLYMAFGFSKDYWGVSSDSAEFGADFYTYQYKATAAAANNVEHLGDLTENVAEFGFRAGGFVVVGLGLAISCLFSVKLNEAKHREELAQRTGGNSADTMNPVPVMAPYGNSAVSPQQTAAPYPQGPASGTYPQDLSQNR